jgi:predicted histone-like DNA-binding protein
MTTDRLKSTGKIGLIHFLFYVVFQKRRYFSIKTIINQKSKIMALFFRKIQKKNMKDPDGPKLWYPVLRSVGVVGEKELGILLANETTLNPKEAEMAIHQLQKILLRVMLDSKTVRLGEVGNYRLTAFTESSETKEEVTAEKIKQINMRFLPTKYVREQLQKATFKPVESLDK